MMNYLLVALISLLSLGLTYGRTIKNSINELVTRFDMPELRSISNEKELYWFIDRDHITDPVFFFSTLMNELKNPESFPQSRYLIAKYGLRKLLTSIYNHEQQDHRFEQFCFKICVNALVQDGNFGVLFELVITFGSNMINFLEAVDSMYMKQITEEFLVFPERQQFMDIISGQNRVTGFIAQLFAHLILSDAPESFYINCLVSNEKLSLASFILVINECEMKVPTDMVGINKVNSLINAIEYSEQNQSVLSSLKNGIRIAFAPDNVTLADFVVNFSEYDASKKFNFMMIAGNHGKDILLREALATLSIQELITFANYVFASSKLFKKLGLKFAVKLYNMLPECVRGRLHESESYLQAAVQWLRLESVEELPNERYYSHKLTFKADPEQIADGLFQEMVYYHRRESIFNESYYAFDLKFTSAESFANFHSHNLRNIFPHFINSNFPTSKDTLNLLVSNQNLKLILTRRGLKILIFIRDLIDYIVKTSIENIPNVGNLIRENLFNIEILSLIIGSDNFAKIEKFTDKCIVEIVNQALNALSRPVSQYEYFKIRGALVYLINGPDRHRIDELPDSIKLIITQEFPFMTRQLTFS